MQAQLKGRKTTPNLPPRLLLLIAVPVGAHLGRGCGRGRGRRGRRLAVVVSPCHRDDVSSPRVISRPLTLLFVSFCFLPHSRASVAGCNFPLLLAVADGALWRLATTSGS